LLLKSVIYLLYDFIFVWLVILVRVRTGGKEVELWLARFDTIRSVLSIAAVEDLIVRQFDVRTAFLYGDLPMETDIYMKQTDGFDDGSGRVCRLKRSLYGLKQAPRWYERYDQFMRDNAFIVSNADPCLYIRRSGKNYSSLFTLMTV
jgi:uncharacterized protein YjaZ